MTNNEEQERRCKVTGLRLDDREWVAKAEVEADIELSRLIDKLCTAWCIVGFFAGVIVGLLVVR